MASVDCGGKGAANLPEHSQIVRLGQRDAVGKMFVSDDKGNSWRETGIGNFCHARVFYACGRTYLLGHASELVIFCSEDDGETWDSGTVLIKDRSFHAAPTNIWRENGFITLAMEEKIFVEKSNECWPNLAPIVMRAREDADLCKTESWSFSETSGKRFRDIIKEDALEGFGMPFYNTVIEREKHPERFTAADGVYFDNSSGWLETNVVRITDPDHYWYDPSGKTFHLFMRAHTSRSGYCAMMRAVITEENGKEKITLMPQTEPSGKEIFYLPMPGGQMKFHILWDEKTKLYWLLSTQAVDSMTRIDLLPKGRFNIPCDERQRLQLSFSKNMVDWCFAGIVAKGETVKESRHYAAMDIDGDDLIIVSRSGSKNANNPHNTDMATFHRVKNFRNLVY